MPSRVEKPQLTTLRIFIVDDSPIDRSTYTRWIRRKTSFRLDIQEMETGTQAWKACRISPPHCLLLNDQLPDMTGLEFLAKIRGTHSQSKTPIIFLTGYGSDEMADQAIRSGAQKYFNKNTLTEKFLWHHMEQAIEQVITIPRIRSLERQASIILQSSSDGILVVGHDGLIRYSNPAAEHLFQRTSEQLNGSPFGFPISANQTTEIGIMGESGQPTPVEMRVVPIEWDEEPAYLASLRDVTEQRRAEDERRRHEIERQYSQKLESLGVLAGGIAHDFNNLLMTIVARSGLALRALPSDAPAREHLDFIEKAGLRGGELANQMLAFAGQTRLNFQVINLPKLLEDMTPFLRATLSKRLTFEYDLAPFLPPIRADQAQLRQIIMNIVINASEAYGEGDGVVTIRTFEWEPTIENFQSWYVIGELPDNRSVALTIQDTGCGMASETIPKIFDPFFSTKLPGRGLGLAALLGLAQAHAATIAVRSQPDVGTEFTLLFPATTPHPSTKKGPVFSIPTQEASLPKQSMVLVVDDEEDVRVACSMIFEEMGLQTLVASDGQIGIQVFEQHQHEIMVVLLDLTMPNMDGRQFLEHIQRLNATIPVILSSGYSEEEAMKRFLNPDMAAFIQKPYQVETLIAKVEEIRQRQTTSSNKPGL
ncbi:ATP-binding response regulator [Candidatus Nitrospira allomarina]|uniref:histidine kinase n=1 Tax=Candidatus Nitrospira allomarina TaxID=3020900 RepID=A0AA96GFI3_9BACT|nr:response regulator [Candidatus Nitrospira allomarina]WNM57694.1 response regulator [Candidatus Nitrospira allomarina]